MINRILEKLKEEVEWTSTHGTIEHFRKGRISGLLTAERIVQEVAKEYGRIHLNRCDTCTHYTSEEIVPPICYFCCKGMEDNYEQKGE